MAQQKKKRGGASARIDQGTATKRRGSVRWIAEVSKSGELLLRRTELPEGGIVQDMNYPFSQGLTFVARRWRNLMNEELRAAGQSQARWGTLYWITVFGDTVNQTELADRIGVEQPTLGRVLRDLEAEGLIVRTAVSGDRRAKRISLTDTAKPLMREINGIQERVRAQLLNGIAAKDLTVCMTVFAKILSNIDSA
jgi:MarR family transcriptional regulator, transcriptional regulator for hemolysin